MNMVDALDSARKFFPDREAVVAGETRLTYDQLGRQVGRAAVGLLGLTGCACSCTTGPSSWWPTTRR